MLDNDGDFKALIYTVTEIVKADELTDLIEILSNSQITIAQTDYDNRNGGTYGYTIYLSIDVRSFINIKNKIEAAETQLLEKFHLATRHLENERVSRVSLIPKAYGIAKQTPNPTPPFFLFRTKKT